MKRAIVATVLMGFTFISAFPCFAGLNVQGLTDNGYVFQRNNYNNSGEQLADIADWDIALGKPMTASLNVADIDGDGNKDIIVGTFGSQPNPYGGGFMHVIDLNGAELEGWPFETNSPFATSAAVGDVDNDGDMEIAVGSWNTMYLFNHDGTDYDGWPQYNGVSYAASMADLDGDNDLEIIYPSGSILYVRHHDGSYVENFPVSAPENLGSPAIGDIDNDGQLEIVGCTLAGAVGPDPYEIYAWELDGNVMPGFPVATSGVVKSTPSLGDMDNDGDLEIVVAAYDISNQDYIYCIDYQGNNLEGWPIRSDYVRLSSPALADINNDGYLEMFIGGCQITNVFLEILFGYDYQGNALAGWPVALPHEGNVGNINSSPIVVEVDDNLESPEIFVRTYNNIFGLFSNGTFIDGFPYELQDDGATGTHTPSPAIADMDGDGDADMIFGTPSGRIYYVDWDGGFDAEKSSWPMYKHDQWGLSRYNGDIGSGVKDEVALPLTTDLMQNYPNPFNATTNISFTLNEMGKTSLVLYDLLGRKISTLIDEELSAGTHHVTFDASDLASGIYFYKLTTDNQTQTKQMLLIK